MLAILVGPIPRTAWTPGERWRPGVEFGAKRLLEVAVVLLGASVSAATILSAGAPLLVGIAAVVACAILASYGMGRQLGLTHRMTLLVACGNSICSNSAIAAVAPVIGADGEDLAASIAFTAVLGMAAVLGLPLLGVALHMSGLQFGALAGLTLSAVPQVLAATAPMGATAVQVGTLVKLVRVLMLGPVCFTLSLLTRRLGDETDEAAPHLTAGDRPKPGHLALHKLAPLVHHRLPRHGRRALFQPDPPDRPGAGSRCSEPPDRVLHGRTGSRHGHAGGGEGWRQGHRCRCALFKGAGRDQPRFDPPSPPRLSRGLNMTGLGALD